MSGNQGNQMGASPIAGEQVFPPAPEPKHYPPGFLPIYMLKTEGVMAADMADLAQTADPPTAKPMQLANVDDPSSGLPQNRGTPSANAFLSPIDVVPPPEPPAA